ncbi:MAG: hypothetical protein ABJC39_04400 [Chloroflexota bacterium]
MARAKRTERAEARRRYRAAIATEPGFEDTEGMSTASSTGTAGPSRRSNAASGTKPSGSGTTERVGFLAAFRLSIRPVHVRADVASLPWIAVHTKALWVPILITVVSAIATAATGAKDIVTGLLFTYFVVFPAIGGVFIAGFLAPRASWLVGVIVGLVSALCYVALGLTNLLPAPFGAQFQLNATGATVAAFIYSPIMGAFFAAAAAWYRRFLALSSPNRNRTRSQGQKQRPGDGRTRGASTSQKAAAKR